MKDYKEFYGIQDLNTYVNGSNAIQEIGSEFAEDVQLILEKFYNNTYVTHIITVDLASGFTRFYSEYMETYIYLEFCASLIRWI